MVKSVLVALRAMETEGLLRRPTRLPGDVIWSPQLGHGGLVFREEEASGLAYNYQQYYGGRVENFKSGAVVLGDGARVSLPDDDKRLIAALSRADSPSLLCPRSRHLAGQSLAEALRLLRAKQSLFPNPIVQAFSERPRLHRDILP